MKKLWWVSENGQGSLLMAEAEEITGGHKAEALETLLCVCTDAEQQQRILAGRFEVEELDPGERAGGGAEDRGGVGGVGGDDKKQDKNRQKAIG